MSKNKVPNNLYRMPLGYNQREDIERVLSPLDIVMNLEKKLFEHFRYPRVVYQDRKLLDFEEAHKQFIENTIMDLYSEFEDYPEILFTDLLKKYEAIYVRASRLNRIRPSEDFHYRAVMQFFFYVYELNYSLRDKNLRGAFLQNTK